MSKKDQDRTPNSTIKNALRKVWLQSRERSSAVRREWGCCEECDVKQTTAKGREVKITVHHKDGIDWDALVEIVRERLLPPPDRLKVLCYPCHEAEDKHFSAKSDIKSKWDVEQ